MKRTLLLAAVPLALGAWLAYGTLAPPPPALALGSGAADLVACTAPAAASGTLTGQQVAVVAYRAGFRGEDLAVAVAVARAESGWNPKASNVNGNGSTDYGLWEINSVHADLLAGRDWSDPAQNAAMAYRIFRDASGWSPWVTYWSGSYERWMDTARSAVADLSCSGTGVVSDPGPGPQGPDGLRPRASEVRAVSIARWGCATRPAPCLASVGGYAARNIAGTGTLSDHATGRAVDLMLPVDWASPDAHALGAAMADFWAANLGAVGGHYVIFDRRIFTSESGRWRPYRHPSGAHDPNLDHQTHVHISVK